MADEVAQLRKLPSKAALAPHEASMPAFLLDATKYSPSLPALWLT